MFLWFVKNPITGALGAALVALGLYTGWVLWDNSSLKQANVKHLADITVLTTEKTALTASVNALRQEVELTIKAQARLDALITDMAVRHKSEIESLKETENAPETDDGPVAPVLRRAIERLR